MFGVKFVGTYLGKIYLSLPGEEWNAWTRLLRIYR
jgi:hypothetical protein